MDVTIYDGNGLPCACGTEGCRNKATSAWLMTVIAGGASGGLRYSCDQHNPMANIAVPLPLNFTSQTLCCACGQPVSFGALAASCLPGGELMPRRCPYCLEPVNECICDDDDLDADDPGGPGRVTDWLRRFCRPALPCPA